MKKFLFALIILLLPVLGSAQTDPASQAARQWRQGHEQAIVDEFFSLLSLPNVSRDKEGAQRNAEAISKMMEKRGLAPQLMTVPGANPVVFGEIRTPGASRTIVFYAHYDGQALDPKEWATPPFSPVMTPTPSAGGRLNPESRIYARSAADDKAPIIALLAAIDGIRAAGLRLKSNVKFVFEGEEEVNSPNLGKILDTNKDLFAGDVWLICDGPLHQTRRQLIVFGARGVLGIDLTVYGPRNELHSGHYGNWVPNPAMTLARLLVSMKDDNGRVLVPNFYDGIAPLSATEKRAIAEAPAIESDLMKEFWIGSTDGGGQKLNDLITLPSLNIRGMASSRIGDQASNVIPSTASASLDIRLVKGMDASQVSERVFQHIRKQGFFIVDSEPGAEVRQAHQKVIKVTVRGGDNAVRTSMDLPISQEVIRVVERARGATVKLPNMGGSLPLDAIDRIYKKPMIVIPIGNHDNNQHSFNENLRLQNLWDGIELMAALLTM